MWLLGVFQLSLLLSSEFLCGPDRGSRLHDPMLDPFLPASQRQAATDAATSRVSSEWSLRLGKFVRGDA